MLRPKKQGDIGYLAYFLLVTDGGRVCVFSMLPSGKEFNRKVFWSGRGRPSTRAILEYLFKDELSRAEQKYETGVIRDLCEAYEVVHWVVLVYEAN